MTFSVEPETARASRLKSVLSDPMTEVYLFFYQAVLQLFITINKLLQREDSILPIMHAQFYLFLKKLLGRFVNIAVIQSAEDDLTQIDYADTANQLPGQQYTQGCSIVKCINLNSYFYPLDRNLFVGMTTSQLLRKLLDEGDVSPRQVSTFYKAARSFYCKTVSYAIAWLPINDEVLLNARFVNFSDRTSATIEQVIYFVNRYN